MTQKRARDDKKAPPEADQFRDWDRQAKQYLRELEGSSGDSEQQQHLRELEDRQAETEPFWDWEQQYLRDREEDFT